MTANDNDQTLTDIEDSSFQKDLIDLLSERIGGRAISCSDDWFAGCENLVKPGRGVFEKGVFVASGQLMDGWESRRGFRRTDSHGLLHEKDWCILRMAVCGHIEALDIDTNNFRGNAPEQVSVQAAKLDAEPNEETVWATILEKTTVSPNSQNVFASAHSGPWTHLKLTIFPDGGVARFRAYGHVELNPKNFIKGELIDLACMTHGAKAAAASDMFFSAPSNLTLPDRAANMGDGWETKRRRDQGNDWAIIKLALPGTIRKVIIDTSYFKGNFPDSASLEAINIHEMGISEDQVDSPDIVWQRVIPTTPMCADKEHLFIQQIEVDTEAEFTHVRLNIFPDGGISRLRVYGFPNWQRGSTECN